MSARHICLFPTSPFSSLLFSSLLASTDRTAAHKNNSKYFNSPPNRWNLIDFLKYRHPRDATRRKIVDSWVKSLESIAACNGRCHTDEGHERAKTLLSRYRERDSSDRKYAKIWTSLKKSTERPPPAPATINYAPVFQNGGSAPLFQNGGSAPVFHTAGTAAPVTISNKGAERNPTLPVPSSGEGEEEEEQEEEAAIDEWELSDTVAGEEEDEEDEEVEEVEQDGENEGYTDGEDGVGLTDSPPHILAFHKAYRKTDGHRWRLSSGRDVETVLFSKFHAAGGVGFHASLALSFILDLGDDDDNTCKNWFSNKEWSEIKATIPPLSSEGLMPLFKSFDRFDGAKSVGEFRHRVDTTRYKEPGEIYNREKHYDLWSADLAVQHILGLWEDPDQPLRAPQLEDTLSSCLWTHIIDHPLLGLAGVHMVHKESSCRSTARRKNRHRTLPTQRQLSGPKMDGIIRSIKDHSEEFGAMEVASSFGSVGAKSTKLLVDTNKLIKTLRDMLFALHQRVNFDPAVTGKLQVVGIMCAGLQVQFLRLYCKGHVSILVRERIEEVPVDCLEFEHLKSLLVKFAIMKKAIAQSVTAVSERVPALSAAEQRVMTDEERLQELLSGKVKDCRPKLDWAGDSPPPDR
ncbi:hypothetical protein DFP73DRAFT_550246 [Morchella snyderi]|nr:hypothetical protein DFP73DRAFT_550246 [Morchella snyderi]